MVQRMSDRHSGWYWQFSLIITTSRTPYFHSYLHILNLIQTPPPYSLVQAIEGPLTEMRKEKLAHCHTQPHLLTPGQELSQHLGGLGRQKPVSLWGFFKGPGHLLAERGGRPVVALSLGPSALWYFLALDLGQIT